MSIPLNWRAYQAADEREQELFNQAHQRSHRFMCGILLGVIFYYQVSAHNIPALIYFGLLIYVLAGYVLSEWIGGRVFVGQGVSFKQLVSGVRLGNNFWQDLVILGGFLAVAYLTVALLGNAIH